MMTSTSYIVNRNGTGSTRLTTGESNVQKAKRILEQNRSEAPVSPSRWRAARSSASLMDCTHETTSTATTLTEPSHEPHMESAMMRTRTNFGDYQYYVPPETKCSPYRVPNGAPVSPSRDPWSSPRMADRRAPERLNLPMLPVSPKREPREDRELDSIPSPLNDRRLQLFDDVHSDQPTFDQVWNQQEFSLDLDRKDSDDEIDCQQEDKPFDERPPNITGLPGSSATSAFTARSNVTATISSPPPPPPPTNKFTAKASPRIRARAAGLFQDSEMRTTRESSIMDMSEEEGNYGKSYMASNDEGDIPSDEDEVKLNRFNPATSLTTASRRTTAEEFGPRKAAEDLSSPRSLVRTASDEKSVDSLFDFERQQRSARRPTPPKWRQEIRPSTVCEDQASADDNSDEKDGIKSLKARAQEAFASRKKNSPRKSPSPRPMVSRATPSPLPRKTIAAVPTPPSDGQEQGPNNDAMNLPLAAPKVTFTATNTVHHFQHEYDMYSDNGESSASGGTFEDKSMGAEVEEALKDIFMLTACNPSPRQIRYHTDTRFERRESEITNEFSDEEDTITAAVDDESIKEEPEKIKETGKKKEDNEGEIEEKLKNVAPKNESEDVFYEAMMSMVEGGIGAMSAAFGFASNGLNAATRSRSSSTAKKPLPKSQRNVSRGQDRRRSSPDERAVEGVLDSMSDYVLGSKSDSSEDLESAAPQDEREYDSKQDTAHEDDENGPQSLEDDPRLLELAKQSALCIHEILGVRYDESRGVDISDVKFVVVVLSLPLGIIFQEDYSGCWVTKVLPKGNAELKGIEAGDQLAAVNSRSSIGMKVDDICAAISKASSEAKEIELTFLRYVGPFRPVESDGASRAEDSQSISSYPFESQLGEEEKPGSTMSVSTMPNSRSSKKESPSIRQFKRGSSFRKKFKWLSRGKKQQASKAE